MKFKQILPIACSIFICLSSFGYGSANAPMITIGLKFVEYNNPATGKPVLTRDEVQKVITGVNYIYRQCNLQVKLDQYVNVNPVEKGLAYQLASMNDLDSIREKFDDRKELVIINTGPWNHKRMGAANAWTAMPGQDLLGAVIEDRVASDAPITAHELGHYVGLDHVHDSGDMMNPLIYATSTRIDAAQCKVMRQMAQSARIGNVK